MKQFLIKITKFLLLFLSWLTLSPLFLYLASNWKLIGKKVRILLFVISPLMLIIYLVVTIVVYMAYDDYNRKHRFADNDVIERITGVRFPEVSIIDYQKGGTGFTMDYSDELTLEMEKVPNERTYQLLDSLITSGAENWDKENNTYSFETMWGNGIPAPEGENEEDIFFSLIVEKGSKTMTINYGTW